MGPVHRLDRSVPASAETQRLALRSTRDIVRRAFGQVSFPRPGPEQFHRCRRARQVGLHSALEAVDLAPPPLFHRPGVKPPDPDEDIDGAHITLGGERRVRSLDDTIGERVPVHRFMDLVEIAAARLSCRCQPELSFYARVRAAQGGLLFFPPQPFSRPASSFRLTSPNVGPALGRRE